VHHQPPFGVSDQRQVWDSAAIAKLGARTFLKSLYMKTFGGCLSQRLEHQPDERLIR